MPTTAPLEADVPLGLHDLRNRLFVLAVVIQLKAGGAAVERGQLIRAQTQNGNALRLEIFQRQAEVENALCTRADDTDGGVGQFLQVGGDVHRLFCAAMHTANTAGGEESDACHGGDEHGGCNGGRAGHAGCQIHSHVTAADLADALSLAHDEQFFGVQANLQLAAHDRGRCGNSALCTDDLFDLVRKLHVLRIRHTVAQNGGFQCDDRLARVDGLLNFRGNRQIILQIHMNNSFQMGVQDQMRCASRISSSSAVLIFGLMVRSCDTAAIPAAMA